MAETEVLPGTLNPSTSFSIGNRLVLATIDQLLSKNLVTHSTFAGDAQAVAHRPRSFFHARPNAQGIGGGNGDGGPSGPGTSVPTGPQNRYPQSGREHRRSRETFTNFFARGRPAAGPYGGNLQVKHALNNNAVMHS